MTLAVTPLMIGLAISPGLSFGDSMSNHGMQTAAVSSSGVSSLAPESSAPECFLCHHDRDGSNVSKRHRTGRS